MREGDTGVTVCKYPNGKLKNGMQVCERLKADPKTQLIPIIMLSARSEEADVIGGLSRGADDYMTKPFSQAELLARIKVALRRKPNPNILSMGSLLLDLDAYHCSLNGKMLKLTTTILFCLITLCMDICRRKIG